MGERGRDVDMDMGRGLSGRWTCNKVLTLGVGSQQAMLIQSNLCASMVSQALTRSLRAHTARSAATSCHAREWGGSGRMRETYSRQVRPESTSLFEARGARLLKKKCGSGLKKDKLGSCTCFAHRTCLVSL